MTLKWNLVTKGMRPHAQLQSKLEQKIAKLETHLEHFPSDAVHLQVSLERHPETGLVRHRADPSPALEHPAEREGRRRPAAGAGPAFKALLREVAGLKSELRREKDYQEVASRKA